MTITKKYRFITITEHPTKVEDKPVFIITNNKTGDKLGEIGWYSPFKKFMFTAWFYCVFSFDCLQDIASFMEGLK